MLGARKRGDIKSTSDGNDIGSQFMYQRTHTKPKSIEEENDIKIIPESTENESDIETENEATEDDSETDDGNENTTKEEESSPMSSNVKYKRIRDRNASKTLDQILREESRRKKESSDIMFEREDDSSNPDSENTESENEEMISEHKLDSHYFSKMPERSQRSNERNTKRTVKLRKGALYRVRLKNDDDDDDDDNDDEDDEDDEDENRSQEARSEPKIQNNLNDQSSTDQNEPQSKHPSTVDKRWQPSATIAFANLLPQEPQRTSESQDDTQMATSCKRYQIHTKQTLFKTQNKETSRHKKAIHREVSHMNVNSVTKKLTGSKDMLKDHAYNKKMREYNDGCVTDSEIDTKDEPQIEHETLHDAEDRRSKVNVYKVLESKEDGSDDKDPVSGRSEGYKSKNDTDIMQKSIKAEAKSYNEAKRAEITNAYVRYKGAYEAEDNVDCDIASETAGDTEISYPNSKRLKEPEVISYPNTSGPEEPETNKQEAAKGMQTRADVIKELEKAWSQEAQEYNIKGANSTTRTAEKPPKLEEQLPTASTSTKPNVVTRSSIKKGGITCNTIIEPTQLSSNTTAEDKGKAKQDNAESLPFIFKEDTATKGEAASDISKEPEKAWSQEAQDYNILGANSTIRTAEKSSKLEEQLPTA
ncbi:uncharacterized protein PV09_09838, partial [Verruconis gallopava]